MVGRIIHVVDNLHFSTPGIFVTDWGRGYPDKCRICSIQNMRVLQVFSMLYRYIQAQNSSTSKLSLDESSFNITGTI